MGVEKGREGRARVGEKGWEVEEERGARGGEEDFRAFPQFQICHCTSVFL